MAILLFVALGWWLADALPCWSEEVATLPGPGRRILEPEHGVAWDGTLPFAPSCAAPNAPWLVYATSRPHLSLCVRGHALPIMGMPYAASIFSWPLALARIFGADIFAMRKVALLYGVLSLLLTYRLALLLSDRKTATLAALLAATNSTFLVLHGMTYLFETLPLTLIIAAMLLWAGCPELHPRKSGDSGQSAQPSTLRLVSGAVCVALALLASIKSVFLIAPLVVLAWRSGVRFRAIRWRQVVLMTAAVAIVLALTVVYAALDPSQGFELQVSTRLAYMVQNLRLERFGQEAMSLMVFATDMLAYMVMATWGDPKLAMLVLVIAAIPLAWCVCVAMAWIIGWKQSCPLAAVAGALIAGYFPVGVLLYSQFPASNYIPLHSMFGVAMAVGVIGISDALRGVLVRFGFDRSARVPFAYAGAFALLAMNLWNLGRRGDPAVYINLPFNAHVERAAAAYLRTVPDAGHLITTNYNQAGVFEVLNVGRTQPVQAYEYFAACDPETDGVPVASEAQVKECLLARWRRLLTQEKTLPLRVLTSARSTGVDRPQVALSMMSETLLAVSQELRLTASLERQFGTAAGEPMLSLYQVKAGPPERHERQDLQSALGTADDDSR